MVEKQEKLLRKQETTEIIWQEMVEAWIVQEQGWAQ